MQLRFILFADAANLSTNGNKLNLVGEFTALATAQLPVRLARVAVVQRLELSPEEAARPHVIGLAITHPELPGPVFQAANEVAAAMAADAQTAALLTQVYDVVGLVLPRFGRYTVAVTADGEPVGAATLSLLAPAGSADASLALVPAAPGQSGAG